MASFEAALAAGEIDVAHVDAVVVALRRLETDEVLAGFVAREVMLLGYARVERPDRFRRRCSDVVRRLLRDHGVREAERQRTASRVRQWLQRESGMGHLHVELDPERYEKFVTALDAKIDELRRRSANADKSFDELRVEAFMELVTASSAVGVRVPEVLVVVDEVTLRTGVFGSASVSETVSGLGLTPEAVRRLACDGGVVPVVMGGAGVPLDVGRKRRLATRAQRQALRAMYATCAHPQCERPFSWCRIHHLVWWELGGVTDLANLLPLCDQHHHQVHEGGWTLSMTPERVITWRTPGGTVWFVGDTRDRPPARWDQPPPAQHEGPPGGAGGSGGLPSTGEHPGGGCCDTTPPTPPTGPTRSPQTPQNPRTRPPTGPSRSDLAAAVTVAPAPTLPDSVVGDTEPPHPSDEPRDAHTAGEPSWLSGLTPHLRRRWREPRPSDPTLFDHDNQATGP
jgi:hypothetical protein